MTQAFGRTKFPMQRFASQTCRRTSCAAISARYPTKKAPAARLTTILKMNPSTKVTQAPLPGIMKLATLAVTADAVAQDRWGSHCGVDIYALRLGTKCLLISDF